VPTCNKMFLVLATIFLYKIWAGCCSTFYESFHCGCFWSEPFGMDSSNNRVAKNQVIALWFHMTFLGFTIYRSREALPLLFIFFFIGDFSKIVRFLAFSWFASTCFVTVVTCSFQWYSPGHYVLSLTFYFPSQLLGPLVFLLFLS
jgi:hypothetical protein